jgi:uncharacterized membrane protein
VKGLLGVLSSVTKFVINERVNEYRSSYLRNQELLAQVTFEMDRALMTFSIAALAALAALNDKVFNIYGWLSFITLALFIGVVVSVIVGYYFSRVMLIDAQKIISANFKKSINTPLSKNLDKVKYGKVTKVMNFVSIFLFVVGMAVFIVLLAVYIGGYSR